MFTESESMEKLLNLLSEDSINFIMIGEGSTIDIHELIKRANEANITIAGGIFPMVISEDNYSKNGIVIKQISSDYEPILLKDISNQVKSLTLPDLNAAVQSCILVYDGFMKNIPRFLERLYEKYWNSIGYVGAGAGSLSLVQQPCVFTNEGLFEDAAVVLMTQRESSLGVKHGWNKIAGPFVANKTNGNQVIELNWRPAFEVYREVVEAHSGRSFDQEDFFSISKAFPFGIYREDEEDIIRDPISIGENGVINCIGHISQNMSLNIMTGDQSSLIEGAREASRKALSEVSPIDIFVVDCISRVLYLEDNFEKELNAVKESVPEQLPLEGVLSLGEISTGKGGFLELYNKTIVVSAFH